MGTTARCGDSPIGQRHATSEFRSHAVLLREALGDAPVAALLPLAEHGLRGRGGTPAVGRGAGQHPAEWKPWRFDVLPIVLTTIPVGYGTNRSGQSHEAKIAAIRQALTGVERVIIATDPGREGSMIAWEVLEHLGWHGRVDRLKLGALDEVSIRRAFAALAKDPDSGERDYAAYLEALCRQYEDYHLGLNGTRAISLRLRPPAFREPWRFGGVQTPTLAILADLEERIRSFVPQDFFKVAVHLATRSGAELTLWHAPKERIFDAAIAETIRSAAATWSGPLAVAHKDVRRAPPRLFSKDTLARRCAKRFGWDPQHTAGVAQDLYDQGYLSYPRTESEHLPEGQAGDAAAVIAAVTTVLTDLNAVVPRDAAPLIRRGLKGHYVADPGEHHAIVPLRKAPERGRLGADQFRVWELVAKAYLAAHLPDGVDARTSVTAEVETPLGVKRFAVSGSVVRAPGWRAILRQRGRGRGGRRARQGQARGGSHRHPPAARDRRRGRLRRDGGRRHRDDRAAAADHPGRVAGGDGSADRPGGRSGRQARPGEPGQPERAEGARDRRDPGHDPAQAPEEPLHHAVDGKGSGHRGHRGRPDLHPRGARVFPAYGDPVGRAMFEAELAEIGRAATRPRPSRARTPSGSAPAPVSTT